MTFHNPLGSISALSLAANPSQLIPAAVIAGVAVTVGAAAMSYKLYHDYEEKKHRLEIEHINRLHEIHLAKINIPNLNDIQGFPPIFKLIPGTNTAESMHLTVDQVKKIGTSIPSGGDVALATYREAISDAIANLKSYYLSRKDKNDITAGVLSYLLYILESKCLSFAGYAYDIAYLTAITNFIVAYASFDDRTNSQHFSRLGPVCQNLTYAKQYLEKHKLSLSLEDMLNQLKDECNSKCKQLIRCMTKIIVHEKHWEHIETVSMSELKEGILRREYIQSEFKGIILQKNSEIKIDDSIFCDWVKMLANYYVQTLDPDSTLTTKNIQAPKDIFIIPDFKRLQELKELSKGKIPLSNRNLGELSKLEEQFKKISNVFLRHSNFLTTKLDPKSKFKEPKMILITDPNDIATRLAIFAMFSALLHQMISLQYLCTHLLKSVKQLGELYVKNPHHFCRVFLVLEELCSQLKDNIIKTKGDMIAAQQSDSNTMQLEAQEMLPNRINELLDSALMSISALGSNIKDYRYRVAHMLNPNEATYKSVKLEMFEVTGVLADIYNISYTHHPKLLPTTPSTPKSRKKQVTLPPTESVIKINTDQAIDSKKPEEIEKNTPAIATDNKANTIGMSAPKENNSLLESLAQELSLTLRHSTDNLHEASVNQKLLQAITDLNAKAIRFTKESYTTPERFEKGRQFFKLTTTLFTQLRDFLAKTEEQRAACITDFAHHINALLSNEENNAFIDQHANNLTRDIYELTHFCLFKTDSRKKCISLQNAIDKLVEFYTSPKKEVTARSVKENEAPKNSISA